MKLHTQKNINKIETSTLVITPSDAKDFLASSGMRNRPTNASRVAAYAAAMKAGEWLENGETIIFGENYEILDGHHRLLACIQANVPFTTLVVCNVDTDAFHTIDTGASRKITDVVGIELDVRYLAVVSSAARILISYDAGSYRSMFKPGRSVSNKKVIDFISGNRGLQRSAEMTRAIRGIMTPSSACALHYLFSGRNKNIRGDYADTFFARLADGQNLSDGNAIYMLQRRLRDNQSARAKMDRVDIFAITIRAWNHWIAGDVVRNLRGTTPGTGFAFPDIL